MLLYLYTFRPFFALTPENTDLCVRFGLWRERKPENCSAPNRDLLVHSLNIKETYTLIERNFILNIHKNIWMYTIVKTAYFEIVTNKTTFLHIQFAYLGYRSKFWVFCCRIMHGSGSREHVIYSRRPIGLSY